MLIKCSPQCSPSAILHLYQSTDSSHLLCHPKYAHLAHEVVQSHSDVRLVPLSPSNGRITETHEPPVVKVDPASVSHVFHSSGTSGTPKPIPHTHMRSVSSLPRRGIPSYLPGSTSSKTTVGAGIPPSESAAFTTTPLFHGGVSDLLRAWMARSMIYFYPTSDVSITTENVVASVEACQSPPPSIPGIETTQEREKRFRVIAFLSVPYILSILAEDLDGRGISVLKELDFVSTGGAPLDTAMGDAMVAKGVRLVSRLGSSECGCECWSTSRPVTAH